MCLEIVHIAIFSASEIMQSVIIQLGQCDSLEITKCQSNHTKTGGFMVDRASEPRSHAASEVNDLDVNSVATYCTAARTEEGH